MGQKWVKNAFFHFSLMSKQAYMVFWASMASWASTRSHHEVR